MHEAPDDGEHAQRRLKCIAAGLQCCADWASKLPPEIDGTCLPVSGTAIAALPSAELFADLSKYDNNVRDYRQDFEAARGAWSIAVRAAIANVAESPAAGDEKLLARSRVAFAKTIDCGNTLLNVLFVRSKLDDKVRRSGSIN
jgi:hypothetical protein